MKDLPRETRHAARRLLRTPGFTAAAVFTLALAIGANAAIFTLVHRVVLAPLPYPAPERLVALAHGAPGVGAESGLGINPGLYREYLELPAVEAAAMYAIAERTLTGAGDAERLDLLQATPSLGGIVGARPTLGRWFSEADGIEGAPAVALLTGGLWAERFGRSPAILGTSVLLDGAAHEVIGVMPPDFAFGDPNARLIIPLQLDPAATNIGPFNFQGIARLASGFTVEDARAQQNAVIADLPARFPGDAETAQAMAGEAKLRSLAVPFLEHLLGDIPRTLWVLLGSVAVVLLIACANLANLFLVRTDSRQRDMAVRRALGASTANVARHLLAETLLVALASGVLGLWLGSTAVDLLVLKGPVELPRLHEVRIDGIVVGFTLLVSLLAGLSFGLMPLVRRAPPVAFVLQDSGRGSTARGSRLRARQFLMAAQVALALVLLISAGLMLQSFQRLQEVDPGFQPASRLVFRVGLPRSDYESQEAAATFHELLLERLRGLPGVREAALTTTLPLNGYGWGDPLEVRGRSLEPGQINTVVAFRRVSVDYLPVMEIPLHQGRLLDDTDASGSSRAVLINQALADDYFGGQNAVGQQIRPIGSDDPDRWLTVAGVVGNTATFNLREEQPTPKMFVSLRTPGVGNPYVANYVLHTDGSPLALVPAARRVIKELDPNLAMSQTERLPDMVGRAGAGLAFAMVLLALAAGVALLLGLVGVYAVISYAVAQRKTEIGVRLALGALPGDVTGMIVRQSGRVVLLGVLMGVAAAIASTRLLQALLFGVAPDDPLTYAAVATGLFAIAMMACWLPARRAARLDPLIALRSE